MNEAMSCCRGCGKYFIRTEGEETLKHATHIPSGIYGVVLHDGHYTERQYASKAAKEDNGLLAWS